MSGGEVKPARPVTSRPISCSPSCRPVWGRTLRSERVASSTPEGVAGRWGIADRLALALHALDCRAAQLFESQAGGLCWPGIWIISGYRTDPLEPSLNPGTSAAASSFHMVRPALAADLRVGNAPASTTDPSVWAFLGQIWEQQFNVRWGGRFNPPDWNHFDLGNPLTGVPIGRPR